ncbi:hypothetical protein PPL_09933 [Heterostelium album PN500]|uniref:Uncharacterized protein n=1 Tax=Heterostelium pallidum (strain ATCC 26659 / Pp 5 / PN500) TaxID=670386 RepID=D3BPR6_HETP5|nr:hypothetical protein PPL_09933 [Heterostelium album PN500]EFA76628.1 hypothetical protein PPL_09933 [Heterostelium album PN500]|eukprot:XP_020428760.1 hypothetical protein PPL_09933 [Heterostelium album PN500]
MDRNKNIVHVVWTTSNQLVGCSEIKNALKCLLMLVGGSPSTLTNLSVSTTTNNNNNSDSSVVDSTTFNNNNNLTVQSNNSRTGGELKRIEMNNIDEAITRIRIAELLLQYTFNHDEARYHLEKSVFLLDSDSTDHSMELLCKISSYLIDYFHTNNAFNLAKQWLKKAIKYSISLKNNQWLLYFLIKESHILFRENQPKPVFNSIDQAIKLAINMKDTFCHVTMLGF